MHCPQRDDWKLAIKVECQSMLLKNTFTTINSWDAGQLRVKFIGFNWVYKMKYNPDGTIRYKADLVIQRYKQTDFSAAYASVVKLSTYWYLHQQQLQFPSETPGSFRRH
jgi:hypothetical protein